MTGFLFHMSASKPYSLLRGSSDPAHDHRHTWLDLALPLLSIRVRCSCG